MSTTEIVVLAVLALIVAAAVTAAALMARRRIARRRFGREYQRLVAASEAWLRREREARGSGGPPARVDIEPLAGPRRAMYLTQWRAVQAAYVEDPHRAIGEADGLVTRMMAERGYPMVDFDRQAPGLAAEHADVVRHYRAGHIACRLEASGEATVQQVREGMAHFRALFSRLIRDTARADGVASRPEP